MPKPKPKSRQKSPKQPSSPGVSPTPAVGIPHMPKLYGIKPRKKYLPWGHADQRLARSRNYWICTVRPDGRPHSIPVWGFWLDGALYFGTGRATRKARNLAANPHLSIHLESGDDVIILEGTAVEISDKKPSRSSTPFPKKNTKCPSP